MAGETPDSGALSVRINQMLSVFGSARLRRGLTADELLIFLAAGQLSFVPEAPVQTAKPVTYVAISYLLGIPKETVRRKALRLIELGLVECTPPGITVADLAGWRTCASSLVSL